MFRSYWSISLRHLWKNRKTTILSILGLTVGLSCGMLIFLLVSYLFSFDRYHRKADRIYWIVTDIKRENTFSSDATPRPLGDVLRKDYPFVENAVRLETLFGKVIAVPGTTRRYEESRNICFTESSFFQVFDINWLSGEQNTSLTAPNTVVLSKRYARKYFGSTDVIGRILRLDNTVNLTVTGLIGDPPSNTKLGYEILVSYSTIAGMNASVNVMQDWGNTPSMCFVALRPGVQPNQITQALADINSRYLPPEMSRTMHFNALPLDELSHNTQYGGAVPRSVLYILIVTGVLLVLAACINFVNMATAQAISRSKETGIRKAIGSTRGQLIVQFLTETTIVTMMAVVLSVIIVQLNLPFLNNALSVLRADMSVTWLLKAGFLRWFVALIAAVILLTGLYPAFVISRFSPVAILHGNVPAAKTRGMSMRKILVVTQFFITQFFIIAVIVMTAQVRYMQQHDPGFRREAIVTLSIPQRQLIKQETLRQQLLRIPGVEQVSAALEAPVSFRHDPIPFTYERQPTGFPANLKIGDMQYVPLFGLHFLAGGNFSNNDTLNAEAIVSSMLVKQLGIADPHEIIGKQINVWGRDKTITGVVADFHSQDLHYAMKPVILLNYPSENRIMAVKIHDAKTLRAIRKTWEDVYPDQVFHLTFVEDIIAQFYLTERILLGLAQIFGAVAIFIGCLGLYGLILFMSAAMNKEIGIRKVFGASVAGMLALLIRDIMKLTGTGVILATPVAVFMMDKWLQGFAYRVQLQWWMVEIAILGVGIVALVSTGWEAVRAAGRDPVKVLKAE